MSLTAAGDSSCSHLSVSFDSLSVHQWEYKQLPAGTSTASVDFRLCPDSLKGFQKREISIFEDTFSFSILRLGKLHVEFVLNPEVIFHIHQERLDPHSKTDMTDAISTQF